MHRILTILASGLLAMTTSAVPLKDMALSQLEQRVTEIDGKLAQLANYSLGIGIGAIGFRSDSHETAHHPEWIQIDFGTSVPIDEIHLVPAIRRDTENGFQADGFPMHFRIIAGTKEDTNGVWVAEYSCDQGVLPRIAPLIVPCNGIAASWIRVEAEQLSARAFDERYVFQLSEVLVFSGEKNVALHQSVTTSTDADGGAIGWSSRYAVDGFMPYLMDSAEGEQSIAYLTPLDIDQHPALTLDLEEPRSISGLHLHAVDQSDTLPQAFAGDFGIPKWLRIEGANQPDFSDAQLLHDLNHQTIYDVGPIMMWNFPEATCRYIRLNVIEPSATSIYGPIPFRFGFAEIEVFSNGRNVALGKETKTNFNPLNPYRPLSNLTDGRNMFGNILPLREWLQQLAMRHELETERPLLMQELNQRYTRQKANLRRMNWVIALLVVVTVIIMLIDRMIRQRAVYRTRERIAADLHDELGANIHAIGLLGDLAQASKDSPDKLGKLLKRMRALTERTGAAARHCTNLLEAKGLYEDLVEDMRRTSTRIMADLDHRLTFEGEEVLKKLSSRRRIDLFLFYKESLVNIIRHSGATEVRTHLSGNGKQLTLTITDNGHGLNGEVPSSLKRRARLLGGHVESTKAEPGGTRISLTFKLKKLGVVG